MKYCYFGIIQETIMIHPIMKSIWTFVNMEIPEEKCMSSPMPMRIPKSDEKDPTFRSYCTYMDA